MATTSLARSGLVTFQKYSSLLVGNPSYVPPTFVLLESAVLTGDQASVEFTNLSTKYAAEYQHLQIRYTVRTNRATSVDGFRVQLNSDTGSNYASHAIYADGVNLTSSAATSTTFWSVGQVIANSSTAGSFSAGVLDLLDPFETTKNKTARILQGGLGGENPLSLSGGVWLNTNSTTAIKFFPQFGSAIVQNSRFSLYGVKATA